MVGSGRGGGCNCGGGGEGGTQREESGSDAHGPICSLHDEDELCVHPTTTFLLYGQNGASSKFSGSCFVGMVVCVLCIFLSFFLTRNS